MFRMPLIKFDKAKSDKDCNQAREAHSFAKIESKEIIRDIRKQNPEMTSMLWMCEYCAKVKESY
jgi:hypothetical protein